ncbi:hypothetical protein UlMin_005681 [Ulmus minor]
MEGHQMVVLVLAASLLMGCTNSALGREESDSKAIHVTGKVLCQDCSQDWNEWVHGNKPIKGSIVSITCMDERSRVVHYASDVTDKLGQFELKINLNICAGKKLNPKFCWVRLVSSPHPTCNLFTNFGGGHSGIKLGNPTGVYRDSITYKLGPFYYTTPMCDKPDTSDDQDNNGNNY